MRVRSKLPYEFDEEDEQIRYAKAKLKDVAFNGRWVFPANKSNFHDLNSINSLYKKNVNIILKHWLIKQIQH